MGKSRNTGTGSKNVVVVGRKMGKLEWQARFVVGKLRSGASATRKDRLNCLGSIGRAMQHYGLNSIKDIKPSHVVRYFVELKGRGLSEGRIANHASAMRHLCAMMGKSEIVPPNSALYCTRNVANRTKHADERIDAAKAAEVRARLSESNRIAYDMARHFGLRQKETLLSHRTTIKDGVTCLVVEGAKGGRPRVVPVTTDEQRELLTRNASYRASHGGKLIDKSLNLKQGLKRLQNELAAGATRTSGANMHTLRREWIIERCEQILAAPESERQTRLDALIEEIGHGREEVIRAYTRLLG